ncbi:MAG: hypothetical protein CM15mP26_2710 [Actinomycetota bacterium]|nr:MAG: hypothetical protein CM15mP26_2710 [Actinomycetota bacterium]
MTNSKKKILNTLIIFNLYSLFLKIFGSMFGTLLIYRFFFFMDLFYLKKNIKKYLVPFKFFCIFSIGVKALIMAFFSCYLYKKRKKFYKIIQEKLCYWVNFQSFFWSFIIFFQKNLFIRKPDYTGGGQDLENNFLGVTG